MANSLITTITITKEVVGILGLEKQTKESARRYVIYCVGLGHVFLLYDPRPYVSIMRRSAICFYCVALGHMFLLCGARPYVSIMWRSAICFYCMCGPYVFIGACYESYHMFSLTMEPSTGHVIKYYKHGFTWKLSDYFCRLCICPYI